MQRAQQALQGQQERQAQPDPLVRLVRLVLRGPPVPLALMGHRVRLDLLEPRARLVLMEQTVPTERRRLSPSVR